ncbi:MAG: phospholipid carrier-dependent glycosyltransferase [Sideroxydans sp.]|nr:phospholipid carrier-dependent glycosyltransferase [Sideroxydans sp.]
MLSRIVATRSYGYIAVTLLAVLVYFFGLDSQHIPRNGDEEVYAHITRLTAQSAEWLPLQSNLDGMRNTKPPLLFWQGISSTHWGADWDWWHLRYPSVIYTLLTALLLFLLAKRISGKGETGFIAAITYLAFFSTYRYGRPFLVNPGEVFWLFLPFFTLLYWRPVGFASRWFIPLLLGAEIGVGLLYKSFALLAPIGMALTWWYLHQRHYHLRAFVLQDALKLVLIAIVSLSLFSLWFALDPNPQSIWNEFVVGENAGKMDVHSGSYWGQLLWGGSSVWALVLGYPMNAGLLAFPVAALFVLSYRRRYYLSAEEKLIWMWMAVLFLVFAIPSQRSARYLLEAMPGVALLCALNWHRIPRWTFVATLVASLAVLMLLGSLAMGLEQEVGGLYGWVFKGILGVTVLLAVLAIFKADWTRSLVNVVALLTLLLLAAFLRPFDGAMGRYGSASLQAIQSKDVWVPCNFRAHDEGYRFLLEGAQVHAYNENPSLSVSELAAIYPVFAAQLPLQAEVCVGCKVLGQRLEIRGRHNKEELHAMLRGEVYQHLFVKEVLLESPQSESLQQAPKPKEGCR